MKQHLLNRTDSCPQELRAAAVTHIDLRMIQHGGGGALVAPSLAEELRTADGFYGNKSPFSLRLWPLVGGAHARGWPNTQEHLVIFKFKEV